MPSTYSTNLKIELQANGENSTTWGTITNTNLGTALEQAIVGYGNPSFPSDANLTLSYTDTNAAQAARALVLNVTSAVSLSTTRELVVPTIQKQYIVQNNTSGSQSITVKTAAGSGVTVPNGRKAHLYVDGTNVIYMDDYVDINGGSIDGTTIGGSSAAAGTFTTLGATTGNITTVNATTVDTTNIEVTNIKAKDGTSAATIADSTGVISLTANPTLSGGTANGVLYLNGSKVATSGSVLVFDGTNVNIGGSGSGSRFVVRGTGTTSATFSIEATTSGGATRFLVADDGLCRWYGTSNAETMRLDNAGNLGIGTASPAQKLHVASAGNNYIVSSNTSGSTSALLLGSESGQNTIYSWTTVAGSTGRPLAFYTGASEAMRLDTSGNLGIGTASPSTKLQVIGNTKVGTGAASNSATFMVNNLNASATGIQLFQDGQESWIMGLPASSTALTWANSGSEKMRLDTVGNLGIGTTTINYRAVADCNSAGNNDNGFAVRNTNSSAYGGSYNFEHAVTGGNSPVRASYISSEGGAGNSFMRFATTISGTLAERMRLDASGQLLLGTTSAFNTAAGRANVSINGSSTAMYNLGVANASAGYLYHTGTDMWLNNVQNGILSFYTNNTERGRFTAGGDLLVGTSTTTTGVSGSETSVVARGKDTTNTSASFVTVTNDGAGSGYFGTSGTTSETFVSSKSNHALVFGTNATARGRFTSGGRFLVGTTTTTYPIFFELPSDSGDWFARFHNTQSTSPFGLVLQYTAASPNGSSNEFLFCVDSGATRATIRSNGGLANYQTNDVNLSDERVKTDIAPLGPMWAKIKALEIVTFKYKDQTHDDDNIGLIAQQVESVAPEFVDADGWGETPEDGVPLKSIYTADMYHAAIKALQEAMARIESLEADMAALKGAK